MRTVAAIFSGAAMLLMIAATSATAAAPAGAKSDVEYEENLGRVPESDPAPTNAPKMLDAVKGRHPRLLFTAEEIDALREHVEKDPILAETLKNAVSWAKRAGVPRGDPPSIVVNTTAALTSSVGQYPALAYAYAFDPDPKILETIKATLQVMLDEPYWDDSVELDSSMGGANNMFMIGLLFDTVYNDLEPEFRTKMARKMLTHVRRMYYLGYLQRCTLWNKYWQQDPANNHRWHRGAGMAACLLSIADIEGIEAGYILQQFKEEMDFLTRWYPHDGDCHEGAGYQVFGFFYLATAARMMDRVLGTDYLEHPGFRNAWAQHVYYWAPGRQGYMTFGDAPNGERVFSHLDAAFFICPRLSRDADVQAMLLHKYEKWAVNKDRPNRGPSTPWTLLACYDPTVPVGDYRELPTHRLFPDLGAASMRDSWDDDAVLFTFKCGPYGGYALNAYRHANPDDKGNPHYVNIAHDDPDAGCFALGTDGEFLFHPGTYATSKMTETNNTLTVDGKGQKGEGDPYTQPVPGVDMRTLSYLTGWKVDDAGRIIVEGEAGNAYDALERFRRTAVWMPGQYILILDDVRADGQRRITWRGLAEKAQFEDPADGRCYSYTDSGKRLDFQMLANKPFNGAIDYCLLLGRWSQQLKHQFQFFVDDADVKFACLMDPWKKKVGMTLQEQGDVVTLTVRGQGIEDVWTWTPAPDMQTPSSLVCTRDGKKVMVLTAEDKAPHGDSE